MPNYKTLHLLGMPIAFGLGLLMGTQDPNTYTPTYAYVEVTPGGDEYVEDSNLSLEDCKERLQKIQHIAYCEPEQ